MNYVALPESRLPVLEKAGTHSRPVLLTEQGEAFELPPEGSLGLLALGYLGLMAWRDVRRKQSNTTT